jgi:hypothetical protein
LENILANRKTIENFFLHFIEDRPIKASHKNDNHCANNKNKNDKEKQITLMMYIWSNNKAKE